MAKNRTEIRRDCMTLQQKIRRFLGTGGHTELSRVWAGNDFLTSARTADQTLRKALLTEIRRAKGRQLPPSPTDFDPGRFTLDRVPWCAVSFLQRNNGQYSTFSRGRSCLLPTTTLN
jgi:hypothetical protein